MRINFAFDSFIRETVEFIDWLVQWKLKNSQNLISEYSSVDELSYYILNAFILLGDFSHDLWSEFEYSTWNFFIDIEDNEFMHALQLFWWKKTMIYIYQVL